MFIDMSKTRNLESALLCFVVAMGLYALSVGPAIRFLCGGKWTRVVETIWCPVMALDHTSAQPIYRAYLGLWGIRIVTTIAH